MTTPTYVLGTGLSHDGSACLLKDGEICVAIEKERVTRRKHDGWNDRAAIEYCLRAEGIGLQNIALLVQNGNFTMFQYGSDWFRGPRGLPPSLPLCTISHHLAHAYSALHASRFEDATVLVIDGCGNSFEDCVDVAETIPEQPPSGIRHLYFEKDSFYLYRSGHFRTLYKDFSPWGLGIKEYPMHPNTTQHSIGGLYLAASEYVFGGFDDAGKLMGLAPYGRKNIYDFPIFDLKDGRVMVRYDWMPQFREPARGYQDFRSRFQYFADIAYCVQKEVERAILYTIESRRALHPSDNLCYSGGVALNAVANGRIARESGFKNLFIQPAAGDNGVAVGCAYYGWIEVLKGVRRLHTGSTYLGMSYPEEACGGATEEQQSKGRIQASVSGDLISDTAELLADGKVVGWFQTSSEFGPRALGNRSILADPRRAEVRDFINAHIKRREDFRPFAPSVLAEDVSTYFDGHHVNPYMLLVAPVREEWRNKIPSVVHCDGSARLQTVSREQNPRYYDLLLEFKRRTGIGLLLNTSLNRRGMPIVETPGQAIEFLLTSALDYLILGDRIIAKTDFRDTAAAVEKYSTLTRLFSHEVPRRLQALPIDDRSPNGTVRIDVANRLTWVVDFQSREVKFANCDSGPHPLAIVEMDDEVCMKLFDTPDPLIEELVESGRIKISGDSNVALHLARALRLTERE
jgi:carbamoyltransferase